jgi:hypothetical protein
MELVQAVRFDQEFLEYFDNIITTIIPKATIEMPAKDRLAMVDKILRAKLAHSKWELERVNQDWLQIIELALKHYQTEQS